MKKTLLFFAFLAVLIAGIWYFLAEKFESIVHNEMLPKLNALSQVIDVDREAINIDKYKFSVGLGQLTIFPGNKDFSISMDNARIYYNPITDKFVLRFCGQKTNVVIAGKEYYSSNPNDYVDFSRSLVKKDYDNFSVVFGLGETDFYEADTDRKVISMSDGKIDISFKSEGDEVRPRVKVEFDDLDIAPEFSTFLGGFSMLNMFSGEDEKTKELQKRIFNEEVVKLLGEVNDIAGSCQYSFHLDSRMSKQISDSVSSLMVGEPSFKVLSDFFESDKFDMKIVEKFERGGIKSVFDAVIAKSMSQIKGDMLVDVKMHPSDQLRDKMAHFTAAVINNFQREFFDIRGLESKDYLPFAKQLSAIKQYKTDLSFGFDVDKMESQHKFSAFVNEYNIKISGDSAGLTHKEIIEFNKVGNFIDKATDFVGKFLAMYLEKAKISDDMKISLEYVKNITDYIAENGFEIVKIFHKNTSEKLEKDGNFLADIEINSDFADFSIKINGKPASELLQNPQVAGLVDVMLQ